MKEHKTLLIKDLLGMVNDYTKLTIRDVTGYQTGAPGPDGDGIIYNGTCEDLLTDHERICSMEVVNISPQHEYCSEVSLYIAARQREEVYKGGLIMKDESKVDNKIPRYLQLLRADSICDQMIAYHLNKSPNRSAYLKSLISNHCDDQKGKTGDVTDINERCKE